MITAPRSLGAHLYFFRKGADFTVPSAGTCSSTSKPGAEDTGWVDFGALKDVTVQRNSTKIELFRASPGALRRFKVLETKKSIDISFTCQELSDLVLEATFGSAALAAGDTQFNPLEGAEIEGWLKGQIYDQADDQWIVVDMWVAIVADGAVSLNSGDGQPNEVKLMAHCLHSSLNTGTKPAS